MDDNAELKNWYRRALPVKRRALAAVLEQWRGHAEGAEPEIRRLSHLLTGSGASYGFPEISRCARAAELAPPDALGLRTEELLHAMDSVLTAPDRREILIVGGDPRLLGTLRTGASFGDHAIVFAPTAAAAEQHVRERPPALIVLDLTLPDADGRKPLLRWKKDAATSATPVLVMSDRADDTARRDCLSLGAAAFFGKPVTPDALTKEIQRWLTAGQGAATEPEHDLSTGLPNEAGFRKLFRRADLLNPGAQRPMALAVIEVDALPVIRATQGFGAAENVLAWAAKIIAGNIQPVGVLARWGGDRLSALFPSADTEAARSALERAREALAPDRIPLPQGNTTKITFSAGVSDAPGGLSLDEILSRATQALAEARAQGAGRVLVHRAGKTPSRKTIMAVDDDELVIALICHRLDREGYNVVPFSNGATAFAAAPKVLPDLVILDVKMPEMDGLELLERLRRIPALEKTPIVMLTSMGSEADVVRGLSLGADDYIVKPFSPIELVARVQRRLTPK